MGPSSASGNDSKPAGRKRTVAPNQNKESRPKTQGGRAGTHREDANAGSPQIKPATGGSLPLDSDDNMSSDKEEEEQNQQPRRRGHRAGRRRTAAKKKEIATKDKGLIELLLLITKLLAQTTQKTRQVAAAIFTVLIVPAAGPIATALAAEGNNYAAHASDLKTKLQQARATKNEAGEEQLQATQIDLDKAELALKTNGPPAQANFVSLIEACVPEASALQQPALRALLTTFEQKPPDIDVCRLETCGNQDLKKVVLHYHDQEAVALIVAAASKQKGVYSPKGPPPLGAMEEDLFDWIAALSLRLR